MLYSIIRKIKNHKKIVGKDDATANMAALFFFHKTELKGFNQMQWNV